MSTLRLASCFFLVSAASLGAASSLPVPDADNGGLNLPPGFRALIVADNLIAGRKVGKDSDQLRFLTVAPNGDLYGKTFRGGIFALRDTDGDGRFDEKHEFGSGGGTGLTLHHGWLYSSTNSSVYRYKYTPGVLVPTGEPQVIISGLPDQGQHEAKSFTFDGDGRLLVEVGSPSNAYGNPDRAYNPPGTTSLDPTEFLKTHGGFWRFDPDKLNQTQANGFHFSTGHRHSIAVAWQPVAKEFFNVMMGRDQMNVVAPEYYDVLDNAERVSEEMHRLTEGVNLGWPYTYWDPIKQARMVGPEFGGDNRKRAEVGKFDAPVIAFPAHWAPLQMKFYEGTQFPARYVGGALIAFHGSWNRAPLPQDGYNISFVPFDDKGAPLGTYESFANNSGPQRFRMGGVALAPDGTLFISETDRGRIWRVIYTGENVTGSSAVAAPTPVSAGRLVYEQFCAACHMVDGSGAGQMQPALAGSAVVGGDATRLINVVLRGPAAVLPADRAKYLNVMPPFPILNDQQIADLLTYLRQAYGGVASPVTPAAVAAERAKL